MKMPSYAFLLVISLACLFTGCDSKKDPGFISSSDGSSSTSGTRGPALRAGLGPKDKLQRILGLQAHGFPSAKGNVPKAQHYEVIQLIPGLTASRAVAINNKGQVVGWMYLPDHQGALAFLWENGTLTNLGAFDGISSDAQDINDLGEVLVYVNKGPISGDREGWPEGYSLIWKDGTVKATISSTPGKYVLASSINNRSQVVGYVATRGEIPTPFIWERGVMTSLGTLGGRGIDPWSINARGQVVGDLYGGGDATTSAFLWEKGVLTPIEGLEGATSINDRGEIAGWNGLTALVSQKGKIRELGPSIAVGINNRGTVVGVMRLTTEERAIVWERGTRAELPSLRGQWDAPTDINERGQIVGQSNGWAVLWQPTSDASPQ